MQIQTDSFPIFPFKDQVDYWRRLGFALNTVEVSARVGWHLDLLNSRFRGNRVRDISLLLEANLWYLLGTPVISDMFLRNLTPHFIARRGAVPLPSETFLQQVAFGDTLAWAFPFGSFGWNFSLMEKRAEYLHPSQIVWIAFSHLLASLPGNASRNVIEKMNSDDFDGDAAVASFVDDLVREFSPIALLRFLGEWVPRLFAAELDDSSVGKALSALRRALLRLGVDEDTFINAPFNFMHLRLGNAFFEAAEELMNQRKRWEYVPKNDGSPLDSLAADFFFRVDQSIPFDHFALFRANLVMSFPPGGFNEVLTAVAAMLLNRTLIFLAPTDQDRRLEIMSQGEFDRARGGIFLAGQALRRTTLPHLQILGKHFVRMTMLSTDIEGEPRELINV